MWIPALMWIALLGAPPQTPVQKAPSPPLSAEVEPAPQAKETAREKGKRLAEEGANAYERGDEQEAIDRWKEAYATLPKPELLFNLGLVYWRQTSFIDAAEAYNQFLETVPTSHPLYEEAKHNLMECQRDYMRAGKLSARAGALSGAPALEMPLAVEARITLIRKEERTRALWITGASSAAVVGVVTGFLLVTQREADPFVSARDLRR